MMRRAGFVACVDKKCIQNFTWKTGREGPFGKPGFRWEYNIEIDLKEMGYENANCNHLVQNRVQWQAHVKVVINLQVV